MSNLEVPQQRPARPPRSARRPVGVSRTPSPAPTDLTPPSGSDGDPNESREHISSNSVKNIFNVPLPSSYIPDRQSSLVLRPEAKPSVPSRASSLTVQQQQEQERLRLRHTNASQRSSSNKSTEKRTSIWQTFQSLKRTSTQSQSHRTETRKRNTLSLFNFPRKAISSSNLRKSSMASLPTSPATTSAANPFTIPQRLSSIATDNDQIPTINEDPIKDIHDDWAPIQAWLSNVEPVKEEDEAKGEQKSFSSKATKLNTEESADDSLSNYGSNAETHEDTAQEVLLDVGETSRDNQKTPTMGDPQDEEKIEDKLGELQPKATEEVLIERRHSSLNRKMVPEIEEYFLSQPFPLDRKPSHESKLSVEERQNPLHFNSPPPPRTSFESEQFSIPRKPIRDSDLSVEERQLPLHFNSAPQLRMSIESQQHSHDRHSDDKSLAHTSIAESNHLLESGKTHSHPDEPREEETRHSDQIADEPLEILAQEEQHHEQNEHEHAVEELRTPTDTTDKENEDSLLHKAVSSVRSQSNPPSAEHTPDTKDIELPVPPAREEQLYSLVHPLYSPQMAHASHTQRPTEEGVDENKRMTLSYGDILSSEEADRLYDNGGYTPNTLQPNNIPSPKVKTHSPYIKLEESDDSDLMTIEDSLQGFYIDNAIGQAY